MTTINDTDITPDQAEEMVEMISHLLPPDHRWYIENIRGTSFVVESNHGHVIHWYQFCVECLYVRLLEAQPDGKGGIKVVYNEGILTQIAVEELADLLFQTHPIDWMVEKFKVLMREAKRNRSEL